MNYDLAKKLKDAGFPNINLEDGFSHSMGSHSDTFGGAGDSDPCYCNEKRYPTLSELIEACGEEFTSLEHWHSKEQAPWRAVGYSKVAGYFDGLTPEEAVANLWLALNNHERKV